MTDGGTQTSVLTDESQLLHPLRELAADPTRNVMRVGVALIVLQFAVRLVMALRGWFAGDDYAFIGRSYDFSAPTAHYFGLAYAGHVMPGSWVWVWVCSHLAPYNFVLPTIADAIMQAATGVIVLRVLIALFDRRWAVLAPFAVFMFTALTVPAFVWWAAALNQSPQQLAVAGVLLNHVQYLRTGKRWRGWAGVACLVGGLGFSEKTLLASGLVFVLTFAYFVPGPPLRRLRGTITRHWQVWAAYVVVAVPFLAYYKLAVPSPIAQHGPNSSGVSTLAGNQIFHAIIPSFFGGPWRWSALGTNAALATPQDLWVEICAVVFGLGVALTIYLHHRAVFGWLVLLGYEAANCLLLAFSRAALVGPGLGLEFRYSTDVAMVAAICGALTVIPLSAGFAERGGQLLVPRGGATERLRQWKDTELISTLPPLRTAPVVVTLVTLVAASGVYSSWRYTDIFAPNVGRTLIANARKEARHLPAGTLVSDTPVSADAVWNMVYPYTLPSKLLRPLGIKLNVIRVGQSTENLVVLDAKGHFQTAALNGYTAAPGPEANCGYRIGPSPTSVTMPAPTTVPWNWLIRIGYLASAAGTTTITAGTTTATINVHRGAGTVYVLVSGTVDTISFGGLDNGAELCTNTIDVGTAVPVDQVAGR